MTDSVSYFSMGTAGLPFRSNPRLIRTGRATKDFGEMTPVVFQKRLLLLASAAGTAAANPFAPNRCLWIEDVEKQQVISAFAPAYGLGSAFVHGETFHAFAIPNDSGGAQHIDRFSSTDLRHWEVAPALRAESGEELFNESVCEAQSRFIMAFESRDKKTKPFTIYFAESQDLRLWSRMSLPVFAPERYTACPTIRFIDGTYYMLYLEHKLPDWRFETYVVRSRDLVSWEQSPRNPVLDPQGPEDINASDVDLVESGGKVLVYYGYGDQRGEGGIASAEHDGSLRDFLESYFP